MPEGRVVVKAGSVADHPGLAVLGRLANPHHLIVDADESGQLKSVVGSGLKFMARAQETSPPALYEDALCPGYRVAAEQRHPLLDLLPSSLLFENGQGQYRIVASRGQWLYSAGYKLLQQLGPLSALAKDPLAERCRNSQSPYCVFTVSETGFLEADSLEDLVDLVYLMLSTQNDKRAEHACACIEQILFRESVTKQRLDAIEQSLWLLSMLPLPHFPLQEIRVRLLAAIEHVRVMDRTPPPPEGIEDDPYHPNTLLTEWLPCAVILRDLATLPKGGSIDDRRRWMLFQLVERKLSTMVKAQKNRIGKAGTIASSLFEAVGWHNLMELVLPLGVRKQYRRLRRLHGNPTAVISSDALRGAVGALHGYYGARIPGEQFILQLASDPVGILRSYLPDLTAKNSSGRSIWQQLMREIAPQIHQVPRIRDLTALRTTIDSSLPVNTLLSEPLTASRLKENFYGYYVAAETADARLTEQLALAVGGWDAETAYLIRVLSSVKWAPFLLRFSKAKELQLWHSYSLNAAIDKIHASTTNHGLLRAVYRSIDLEPVRTRLVDRLVREGADEVERQVRSQLPTVAIEPLLVKARQAVGLYRAGTGVIDALSSEDDCEAASPEGQNLNAVASIDAEIDALFDALFSIGFELTEETALQPPPMAPFSSSQAESNPVLANRLERINRSSTAYAGQIGSLPMYAAKDADRIVELTIAAHALLQRAGKEIDRAKKKILAQLNNDNQKKFGLQAQRQVTEDDLDRLVLQGNSVDRTGTLPFPADLLPDLDQAWTEIALKETRLKHQLARVIAYLENGELQKAVLELRARRQWTETCAPGRLGRCLLAVEKRAGVLLWDKTVERFLKWIAEVDRSTVSEWIMGLGKTSVGKPAAAEFSADGTHFPVVIWPSQTAATNVSDTSRTAWDVFRKQVHRLRFSREQNITPATLHALLDLHKHIQRDRHALHATRWDISGLDLMRLLVVHNGLTASAMKGSFVRVTRHSQTF